MIKGKIIWAPVEFLKILDKVKLDEQIRSRAEAMKRCADYVDIGKTAKEIEKIKKIRGVL